MKTAKMVIILVLTLALPVEVSNADFTFGIPTNLGPIFNSSANDWAPCISADGLSLYFASARPGGYGGNLGGYDIWVSMRETTEDDWSTPVNVGLPVNSAVDETQPCISADGLSLFFGSYRRPGGIGGTDLWVSTRATVYNTWSEPVNLGPTVNTSTNDNSPNISADGLSLFFHSGRAGGQDLWVTTRPSQDSDWEQPQSLGPAINTPQYFEGHPSISADGLRLFFVSDRLGGQGGRDLWMTKRATKDDPWGPPLNLGPPVNTASAETSSSTTTEAHLLYFCDLDGPRPGGLGGFDIWQAPIIPIVDLNGDGMVDAADMCIMVDNWQTDESLCDIGPTPFGDGIVDVQDLVVLSEYLFKELNDPTLVAHWAFDEIEGDIASDSANDNDGTVYGDPAWQPQGGMVDGALQLDGIDDYISTPFVLNPADGKFSVFVWIRGGAPGQVVLSQMGGSNWLCTDSVEGNLMTELKATGRGSAELLSQTVITDGNWHRIGLVWDGSHRTLYVDDIAVAEDEQTNLAASENGLYIGTGTVTETGSFWSGLIDDVRIYNRVVRP